MLRFFIRRLIVALLVAATVMTIAFVLTRLSGDLAISIAGPSATQADVDAVRKAYQNDNLGVGLHLTLVKGKSTSALLEKISRL